MFATYISLVFTTLFWGGTFIAGRILGASVTPSNSAFLRFAVATLVLAVLTRFIDGKIMMPPRQVRLKLLLLGLTGVFSYNIFFFLGLQHIEAGRASLIIALNPLMITIAAVLFLQEKLRPLQFLGIIISLVGALFVITNGHPSLLFKGGFGKGEAAILGCVLSWTAYSLIGRSVLATLPPLTSVFYSSLIGTILLFPLALSQRALGEIFTFSKTEWSSVLFLGIFGTAIGFSLYYMAIRKIGASRSSVFINLVPLFSILLSWLLLGESIKVTVLTGGIILLSGVYLTNRPVPQSEKK
ncbi:DMT family transporter [Desulfopila sp. IMCC35008]|uniref:DMT family transporter n=1 Tax=Desulfopila sp. IMCC35008 TaxID=2653858 RepID=UPI0013D44BDA|nr:DMT family transporter [Desulfopila sp. IMCC35008]